MEAVSITIIGLGPRGLCVLERILSLAAQQPEQQVRIIVVNKGMPGHAGAGRSWAVPLRQVSSEYCGRLIDLDSRG